MSHFFLNHLDTMSNSITRENHAKIVLQAKVHHVGKDEIESRR